MEHQPSDSWAMLQVQDMSNSAALGRQLPAYRALGGVLLYLAYAVCESEHGIESSNEGDGNRVNRSLIGQYRTSLHTNARACLNGLWLSACADAVVMVQRCARICRRRVVARLAFCMRHWRPCMKMGVPLQHRAKLRNASIRSKKRSRAGRGPIRLLRILRLLVMRMRQHLWVPSGAVHRRSMGRRRQRLALLQHGAQLARLPLDDLGGVWCDLKTGRDNALRNTLSVKVSNIIQCQQCSTTPKRLQPCPSVGACLPSLPAASYSQCPSSLHCRSTRQSADCMCLDPSSRLYRCARHTPGLSRLERCRCTLQSRSCNRLGRRTPRLTADPQGRPSSRTQVAAAAAA